MKVGETKPMKDGRTFVMTNARLVGNIKSADTRRGIRFQALKIHANCHRLVREFVELLNRDRTPLSEVARRSGVDRRIMHRWRIRSHPSIATFEAALNAAGYELRIVRKREEG